MMTLSYAPWVMPRIFLKHQMMPIEIKKVDQFPQAEFAIIRQRCFADLEQTSHQYAATVEAEEARFPVEISHLKTLVGPMMRYGAFSEGKLIAYSGGWHERSRNFLMAASAVLPEYRRQGVYGKLLEAIVNDAQSPGALTIRSQHSVANNTIIVLKLKRDWHITGLSSSAQMGTLVELSFHLSEERKLLFATRVKPFVVT